MISYNNSAKLIFAQGSDNVALNLKAKNLTPTSSDFKSVFNSAVSGNNTDRRETSGSNSRGERELVQGNEPKFKYNSFRDLKTGQATDTNRIKEKLNTDSAQSTASVKSEAEGSSQKPEVIDEKINILAQMLGVTPNELIKLANELGFTSEDINNSNGLEGFVQKLGELLQLNNQQKEVLSKLAHEVINQLGTTNNASDMKVADVEIHTAPAAPKTEGNNPGFDVSKLSSDIKEAINQLIQKGITEAEAISSEISKVIEAMKAAAQQKHAAIKTAVETPEASGHDTESVINTTDKVLTDPGSKSKTGEEYSAKDEEKNTKADNSASSVKAEKTVDAKNASAEVNPNTDQNQEQTQVFGQVKTEFVSNNVHTAKVAFKMPHSLKPSELINQVVEQTKVVLGQDKTEMVIHLKPDHLGKLELKVVTEQGIVAAKFIAESQQVKEVIETNMQLLKDSLQKQGIAIDGVSVQVGKDPQNEYKQNSNESRYNGTANRTGAKISAQVMTGSRGSILETLPDRLAQYSYDTNTINLTA